MRRKPEATAVSSYLPVSLAGFRCYQDGIDEAWVHTTLRSVEKDDTQVVDIRVYDVAERPVAELEGLAVRLLPLDKVAAAPGAGTDVLVLPGSLAEEHRSGLPILQVDRAPASWMIFADAKVSA
mgnify:CR=1 FL=1